MKSIATNSYLAALMTVVGADGGFDKPFCITDVSENAPIREAIERTMGESQIALFAEEVIEQSLFGRDLKITICEMTAGYIRTYEQNDGTVEVAYALIVEQTDPDYLASIIGYQIANSEGDNIQGEEDDPSGYPSYTILSKSLAQTIIAAHPDKKLKLSPIYEGTIQEPDFAGF